MRWKCPACQTEIRYDGDKPQPGRVYHCHVCHLELVVDESGRELALAPLPTQRRRKEDPGNDSSAAVAVVPTLPTFDRRRRRRDDR